MSYDEDKLPTYYCLGFSFGQLLWGLIWIIIINTDMKDLDSLLSDSRLEPLYFNIQTAYKDYTSEFISDIKLVHKLQSCPPEYKENQMFFLTYKGTKRGCHCDKERYQEIKGMQVVEGECCAKGQLDKFQKCGFDGKDWEGLPCTPDCICFGKDIEPINEKTFYGWPLYRQQDGEQIPYVFKDCVLRQKGYSMKTKYPIEDPETKQLSCEDENDKVCGNFICFPKDQNCPVSEIRFQEQAIQGYSQSIIDPEFPIRTNLKFISEHDEMPVLDFTLSGGEGVCENGKMNFDKNQANLQYILEVEQREVCQTLSTVHYESGLIAIAAEYLTSLDSDYTKRLISLPLFQRLKNKRELRHYYKKYNPQYKQITKICQDLVSEYESIINNISEFQEKELKDIDGFYDFTSLAFLGFCLIINVPITSSVMKYNRTRLGYIIISIFCIVGVVIYTIASFYNVKDIVDRKKLFDDTYQIILEYKCPEYQEFTKVNEFIKEINDIVKQKIYPWLFAGVLVSMPSVYVLAGIPLILFKKNKKKEEKMLVVKNVKGKTQKQVQSPEIQKC